MKKPALASDQKHPETANARGHVFNQFFSRFAHMAARAAGSPAAFLLATASIIIWAVTGPVFGYSDTWQLVINTATTIITFLMVFLIQNTQNRDSLALQAKLAELIIAPRTGSPRSRICRKRSSRSFTRIFARAPTQRAMFSVFALARRSRLAEEQKTIPDCPVQPLLPMGRPRIPMAKSCRAAVAVRTAQNNRQSSRLRSHIPCR
jgi:low affinity Fe/Cu permease